MTTAIAIVLALGACSGAVLAWRQWDPPQSWILHPKQSIRAFYRCAVFAFFYLLSFFVSTMFVLPLLDRIPGYTAWLDNAAPTAESIAVLAAPIPLALLSSFGVIRLSAWRLKNRAPADGR